MLMFGAWVDRMRSLSAGHRYLIAAGVAVGLSVRLALAWHRAGIAGDSWEYEEYARNLLDHHVYGLFLDGQLVPLNSRMPGYPLFIAAVYSMFARTPVAVRIVQAVVDASTCALAGGLAVRLAPVEHRGRAAVLAVWLSALCPFMAIYVSVLLTETVATFFTTVALMPLLVGFANQDRSSALAQNYSRQWGPWFGGGLLIGIGTLVRPEAPILAIVSLLVVSIHFVRTVSWGAAWRAGLWLTLGVLLPLCPWLIRNSITLSEAQLLTPRYAQHPGQYVPTGFYRWTRTWMFQYRYGDLLVWRIQASKPIAIDALPDRAFDSVEERAYTTTLLRRYNRELAISPALDSAFDELATERTKRHPLRTYLWIPVLRVGALWSSPFVTDNTFKNFILEILHLLYIVLAVVAFWRFRHSRAAWLFVAFFLMRTIVCTQLEVPEPRYLLVCLPQILALDSILLAEIARLGLRRLQLLSAKSTLHFPLGNSPSDSLPAQ